MKKLIIRVSIFLLPFLLIIIPPHFFLLKYSELPIDINELLEKTLEDDKHLLGFRYNEELYSYLKFQTFLNKDPEVIALGSSRVLPFREEMFVSSFYNCGYTVSKTADLIEFIESVPDSANLRCIILGIDHWMFNSRWDDAKTESSKMNDFLTSKSKKSLSLVTYLNVWEDYLIRDDKQKYSGGLSRFGINAVFENTGFRSDGSMFYGKQIQKLEVGDTTAVDFNFQETLRRIQLGIDRFEHGKEVNQLAVDQLIDFLTLCRERKIHIVAITLPFAERILETMRSSENYKYMELLFAELNPLFGSYDFEMYDYTSLKKLNSSDNDFIDGFHASEKAYLHLLVDLGLKSSYIKGIIDMERLKFDMDNISRSFNIYNN